MQKNELSGNIQLQNTELQSLYQQGFSDLLPYDFFFAFFLGISFAWLFKYCLVSIYQLIRFIFKSKKIVQNNQFNQTEVKNG